MSAALSIRSEYTSDELRRLARESSEADQCRRLLSIASALDGASRSEAARIGGVQLQTFRDWILRFNEEGPEGLIDRKAPGAQRLLNEDQEAALIELIKAGPDLDKHGVVRWRLKDLVNWVQEEYGISMTAWTMSRTLQRLGYSWISARPHHYAQEAEVIVTVRADHLAIFLSSARLSVRFPVIRSNNRAMIVA